MDKRTLIYIAGSYSAETREERDQNIAVAEAMAQVLLAHGYAVICPHTMTHGWEDAPNLTREDFIQNDLRIMENCDMVFLVDGWQDSEGARREMKRAMELGIPCTERLQALIFDE